MLLNYSRLIKLLILSLSAGILISCGSDDSPDTTPIDDDPIDIGFIGEIDFVKTFGGSDEEKAVSLVLANDGGYVILGSSKSTDGDLANRTGSDSDYWLLKLDAQGEKIWSNTFGGTEDDVATNVSKTSDGGYIISGHSESSDGDVTENAGFQDYWIVKVDGGGNLQWEKSYGFVGGDQAQKVFQTSEGNYFATGFFDVGACEPLDPTILCPGNDFQNGSQTGLKNPQHGVGEFWGILMDENGEKIWRRYFGGSNNDRSYDALQTNDGGFLLIGESESDDFDIIDDKGSYDVWVVRLSATGEKLWTRSFGGSEIDRGSSVIKTADGNYLLVGDTRSEDQDVSFIHGNADAWVIKFDDSGSIIWEKTYGGSEFDAARNVYPLADGSYVVAGISRSSDGDVTTNKGQSDIWVFIIDEDGTMTFETTIGGTNLDFGSSAIQTLEDEIVIVGDTESDDFDVTLNRGIKDLIVIKIK